MLMDPVAKLNADKQEAVIATEDGIKVFGYKDLKLSDFVAIREDTSAPANYEKFMDFHNTNPWVLKNLIGMCKNLRKKGVSKYSIRGLFHIIRYKQKLRADDKLSNFALNNNYSSYYARLIMRLEPSLVNFFEIREQKSRSQS